MNCPKCDNERSWISETIRLPIGYRRHRICRKCAYKFSTLERVEVWDPVLRTYAPPGLTVVPDPEPEPQPEPDKERVAAKRASNRRWHPVGVPAGVCKEAAPLLLEWWNESRRIKHGSHAVWSERAWLASVERVKALPPHQQVALCQAGIEQGWQALKPEYLREGQARPALPTPGRRPMPTDPAMLAALDTWPA